MRTEELQKLVKKIFTDEATKKEFTSNPDSVLSRYDLTSQEKQAVMHTYVKSGLITSATPQVEAAIKPTMDWTAAPV